jgi:NAD(P)-dependent dehydrogenase (short-subunit alcohol dehydrogenase family)
MAGRLAGKVALVTGAGSSGPGVGNGKATAILFAREGARVVCVDNVRERAEETAALIRSENGEAIALAADVTNKEDCTRMVAGAVERYGRLDILHNNVGITSSSGIQDLTEAEWDRVLAVDLKSAALASQAALPHLIAAGGGAILFVSSITGFRYAGGVGSTAYAAAKAGLLGLTVSLAGQLAEHRIRVNAIAPGLVYTPLVAGAMSPEVRERRRRAGLIPDEGTAWDVAWAAVFLASDEARWVTGQVLMVDGGLSITTRSS